MLRTYAKELKQYKLKSQELMTQIEIQDSKNKENSIMEEELYQETLKIEEQKREIYQKEVMIESKEKHIFELERNHYQEKSDLLNKIEDLNVKLKNLDKIINENNELKNKMMTFNQLKIHSEEYYQLKLIMKQISKENDEIKKDKNALISKNEMYVNENNKLNSRIKDFQMMIIEHETEISNIKNYFAKELLLAQNPVKTNSSLLSVNNNLFKSEYDTNNKVSKDNLAQRESMNSNVKYTNTNKSVTFFSNGNELLSDQERITKLKAKGIRESTLNLIYSVSKIDAEVKVEKDAENNNQESYYFNNLSLLNNNNNINTNNANTKRVSNTQRSENFSNVSSRKNSDKNISKGINTNRESSDSLLSSSSNNDINLEDVERELKHRASLPLNIYNNNNNDNIISGDNDNNGLKFNLISPIKRETTSILKNSNKLRNTMINRNLNIKDITRNLINQNSSNINNKSQTTKTIIKVNTNNDDIALKQEIMELKYKYKKLQVDNYDLNKEIEDLYKQNNLDYNTRSNSTNNRNNNSNNTNVDQEEFEQLTNTLEEIRELKNKAEMKLKEKEDKLIDSKNTLEYYKFESENTITGLKENLERAKLECKSLSDKVFIEHNENEELLREINLLKINNKEINDLVNKLLLEKKQLLDSIYDMRKVNDGKLNAKSILVSELEEKIKELEKENNRLREELTIKDKEERNSVLDSDSNYLDNYKIKNKNSGISNSKCHLCNSLNLQINNMNIINQEKENTIIKLETKIDDMTVLLEEIRKESKLIREDFNREVKEKKLEIERLLDLNVQEKIKFNNTNNSLLKLTCDFGRSLKTLRRECEKNKLK